MTNGIVQISWNPPPNICAASNISFDVNLNPTGGNIVDDRIKLPTTTIERSIVFHLTPGREYRVLITAKIDCSISSCAIRKAFIATQNAGMFSIIIYRVSPRVVQG